MKEDPLEKFLNMEACKICSSINPKNLSRCPECGKFHDEQIFSDRDEEPIRKSVVIEEKPVDPGMYSLNPNSDIPDDFKDEDEIEDNTVSWSGDTADFRFDDNDDEIKPNIENTIEDD
ncbi:MAG: hypothetical protein CMB56_007515 [Methanobacteriota archaeon]|nr:MAG: hypothetical protein CMB56_007515 [Euryarchaeota archaeon]|tara:strand:+ start:1053 stop:1406 length:354 start_codon:yes stop_codon:yes gene_type:complete